VDAAEAHRQLIQATGAQPYAPILEEPAALEPGSAQAVEPGHGALVEPPRIEATGTVLPGGLNGVALAFGHATSALEEFADSVRKLVETAEEVTDDDGREVWMTAGEVELDQWTQRLVDAAAVVRRKLGSAS
jgi:hypothetical protein